MESFVADLRLLKSGGCDVVLRLDWMKHMSPISFDFNRMEVTFEKKGKKLTLTGSKETGTRKMITGKKLQKMLKSKWAQVAQLFSIQTMDVIEESLEQGGKLQLAINTQIQNNLEVHQLHLLNILLAEFDDLFVEPNSLPPNWSFDHSINLKPNFEPINI